MQPYKIRYHVRRTLCLTLCTAALLSGCGGSAGGEESRIEESALTPSPAHNTTAPVVPTPPRTARPSQPAADRTAGPSGTFRDDPDERPVAEEDWARETLVYTPEAPGTAVIGKEPLVIDISNIDQGYVMARYTGDAVKASVQITGPDDVTYKYFLHPAKEGEEDTEEEEQKYKVLPLTSGSGPYAIDVYENVHDSQYVVLYKEVLEVELEDELLPFLYPNIYVEFTEDTEAVGLAEEIVAKAEDNIDEVRLIYHFVVDNIDYDTEKAQNIQAGYLPVVDETLRTRKGICFDFAALTAAMLRSQGIPTKLEIGYAGEIYHSWISVYTEETGWIDRIIEFSGNTWTRMDPTFAAANNNSNNILKYIGDGSNYTLQYSH